MKIKVRKASDWDFERDLETDFSNETFENLSKEFNCSRFVVDVDPWENGYDATIEIYDDWIE